MEKVIRKNGRKYLLYTCKNCSTQFYRRSDYKKTDHCKDCAHVNRRKPDIKCYAEGCNNNYYAKGLCQFHYDRKRRGTELNIGYYGKKKIDIEINKNGCFICTTITPNKAGYYMQVNDEGKKEYVHRKIYEECFGEIPEGLHIRHKCDNPSCINPEHLETGTHQQNMQDSVDRKRNAFGERNGHAKLKEKDVLEILNLLSKGEKASYISDLYNVHPGTIQAINRGENWRYLTCQKREV